MELATKYDPREVESKWYQYWLDHKLFSSRPDGREPYTVVIPPPNGQLCISKCPNGVLRPSSDPERFMQPEMNFDRGFCRPECTRCSWVCPAGAIQPITKAEKSSTQIGHAVWRRKYCVPLTDNVDCGNCARHCPVGAIQMVPSDPNDDTSIEIPVVNTEKCIGCGSCEYVCPARPHAAIYVEGHEVHKTV